MSENPPASGGWTDPYGTVQAGFPPPGYWQASDGRWYPPEARPAEPFAPPGEMTVAAGPGAGPSPTGQPYGGPAAGPGTGYPGPTYPSGPYPGPTGPTYPAGPTGPYGPAGFTGPGSGPPGAKKSRTGLWVVLGVVAVLFVGCGAVLVQAIRTVDQTVDDVQDGLETAITDTTASPFDPTTTFLSEDELDYFGDVEDGLADIASCTRLDDDSIEVDLTNTSDTTVDYWLTVVLQDTPGQRLADTAAFIEDLRPGERAIEQVAIYEAKGASCEIITADRYPVTADASAAADVSGCEVLGEDTFGDAQATLTAVNSTTVNSDYSVTVAIIGSDNIRRGSGFAYIETVRPGESAPGEVFTTIDHSDDYRCEVVRVERTAS